MSFNQSFSQQQQGGQGQQGQFGNVNMRPQPQRTNSNSSLSAIQPFPPNATAAQGNMGFNPNHLQQLNDFHSRQQQQQQQGMYPGQQQQGAFGSSGYANSNPMYGNLNANQQPSFAQQQQQPQQQNIALLHQQQYLQAARQLHAQAQVTQVSPRPSHLPLQAAAPVQGSFQRPPIPSNPSNQSYPHPSHPPIPIPMQRTFSNQSSGSVPVAAPVQQGQGQTRPQMPISGYEPQLQQQASGSGPAFGINAVGPDSTPRTTNGPAPSQLNDSSVVRTAASPAKDSASPSSAASAPKKRRRPAKPAGKKEEKPAPVVYFTGIDRAPKEEPTKVDARENVGAAPKFTPAQAQVPAPAERRRAANFDGMRGTMRTEIAGLMYAAGDEQPGLETVNYMEDLVVEFIADLCRPSPPIRSFPGALHVAPPITTPHVRHRLHKASTSRPHLIKYANRLDYMIAINEELNEITRNVDKPSNDDLANTAGKEYLGIGEDDGEAGGGGTGGGGTGRRGRPKKDNAEGRRKPGPKKGWKSVAPGEGKKRGPYKKRNREGSGMMTPKGESGA